MPVLAQGGDRERLRGRPSGLCSTSANLERASGAAAQTLIFLKLLDAPNGSRTKLVLGLVQLSAALDDAEHQELLERSWRALGEAARAQGAHQAPAEPARRFLELLASALSSGRAHVAAPDGERPLDAETAWGWRRDAYATWEPKGERVGWVDGEDLYLLPDAAYAAVQRLGQEIGDRIALTPPVLRKRLKERGILLTCETQRRMLTVRRTLEGQRREVLHLHRDALCASTDAPGFDDARGAPWSAWTATRSLSGPGSLRNAGRRGARAGPGRRRLGR